MGLKSGRQHHHQTRNMTRNFSHVSYIFCNPVNHLAFLHTPHKIQFFIAYVIFSFPKAFYGKLPTATICQCFLGEICFIAYYTKDSFITQDRNEQIKGVKVVATFLRGHISLIWGSNSKKLAPNERYERCVSIDTLWVIVGWLVR